MPTKDYRELIIESPNHSKSAKSSRPTYRLYACTKVMREPEEWIIHATDGRRRRRRDTILLHRYLINAKKGEVVDHIDGDSLNNTKRNLRIVTAKENAHNTIKKKNKSGYTGVYLDARSGRYYAQLRRDGKGRNIGTFDTKEKAAEAYDRKVCEIRKVVNATYQLNFPERLEGYMADLKNTPE